jgi:hypothetical protein
MQQQPRHTIWIRSFVAAAALAIVWPAAGIAQGEGSGDLTRSETPASASKPAPAAVAVAKPFVAKVPDTFACNYNDKTGALVECSCKHVEACISLDRSKQCGDVPIRNRPKGGGRCRP